MTNMKTKPAHQPGDILPPDAFVTLLDQLYDLLSDAQNTPVMQGKLLRLIRWVESHIPAADEPQRELAVGGHENPGQNGQQGRHTLS
jgi:hypothetical protein